jgi:hypothetical protein
MTKLGHGVFGAFKLAAARLLSDVVAFAAIARRLAVVRASLVLSIGFLLAGLVLPTSAQAQTDPQCYLPGNSGAVGQSSWAGCARMYIVAVGELTNAVVAARKFPFNGIDYTFDDDANNIFTGQVTVMKDLNGPRANERGWHRHAHVWHHCLYLWQ